MPHIRQLVFVACIALGLFVADAQESTTPTSVAELSKGPRKFDGHLVQVRALLEFGWEGDNFLSDPMVPFSPKLHSHKRARVWFYSKPGRERQVYGAADIAGGNVLGTFTGYFHFVPDQKSRIKDVFDPGPWQLEVIEVSGLVPEHKPR